MEIKNKRTINCRDCGEPTWNRTERCNPCKSKWRNNMSSGYDEAMKSLLKANENLYNRKVESVESLQCSECNEVAVTLISGVCNTCVSKKDEKDEINWPKHYNAGKIQPIDAIESWQLDFRLANAVKYIVRHKHKENPKKDLEKAVWYIQRYIDKELGNE